MFKTRRSRDPRLTKVESDTISSIVDQNMTIRGELSFKGKARIDGTVNGDITGEHLVLSQSGRITGDVRVITFVCHGTIEGNVTADMVTARQGSLIRGTVQTANLVVDPGAALDGEVKTVADESAAAENPGADY